MQVKLKNSVAKILSMIKVQHSTYRKSKLVKIVLNLGFIFFRMNLPRIGSFWHSWSFCNLCIQKSITAIYIFIKTNWLRVVSTKASTIYASFITVAKAKLNCLPMNYMQHGMVGLKQHSRPGLQGKVKRSWQQHTGALYV